MMTNQVCEHILRTNGLAAPAKKLNTQPAPAAPIRVERKVKNDYAKYYRETGGAFLKKKELFEQVVAEENL